MVYLRVVLSLPSFSLYTPSPSAGFYHSSSSSLPSTFSSSPTLFPLRYLIIPLSLTSSLEFLSHLIFLDLISCFLAMFRLCTLTSVHFPPFISPVSLVRWVDQWIRVSLLYSIVTTDLMSTSHFFRCTRQTPIITLLFPIFFPFHPSLLSIPHVLSSSLISIRRLKLHRTFSYHTLSFSFFSLSLFSPFAQ